MIYPARSRGHARLPDGGRISHFEIDELLPTWAEKAALPGEPGPPSGTNRYLTENHAAGGFDGFANPSASVGLVAVNGVATTAMRSDGAPALDQGIVPTWTGLHTFEAAIVVETGAVGTIGVTVKAAAGQTANLQEWQDSGGTKRAFVDEIGRIISSSIGSSIHGTSRLQGVQYGSAAGAVLYINRTLTGATASGNYYGLSMLVNAGGLAGTATNVVGNRFQVNTGTTAITNLMGFQAALTHTGAGSIDKEYGVRASTSFNAGTTISSQYGYYAGLSVNHVDAEVTDAYAFYGGVGGIGTIVNAYGLYLASIDDATTLNYAIYTNAGLVRFGDNVVTTQGITMADDTWIGIGAALERIVFDAAGDVAVMGASLGVGTLSPDRLVHAEVADAVIEAITYAQRLSHTTSGGSRLLFGVGSEHELEDAGGAMQVASEAVTLWAVATAGVESPLYRLSTYPKGVVGPGYAGFWTWDGVDGNARTVIPNGAGDVVSGVMIMYWLSESGGGIDGNVVMVANGASVDLYDDGTDVFTLTVNADGSVTVVRSAGATTADLSLLMCWV